MFRKICRICLRVDTTLKSIHADLVEFHDEMCDYMLSVKLPLYCIECEQMLKKMYLFKKRCLQAIKIYQDNNKVKESAKRPLSLLYQLLPSSFLSLSNGRNTRVYRYEETGQASIVFTGHVPLTQHHIVVVSTDTNSDKEVASNNDQALSAVDDTDVDVELEIEDSITQVDLQEFLQFKNVEQTDNSNDEVVETADDKQTDDEEGNFDDIDDDEIDDIKGVNHTSRDRERSKEIRDKPQIKKSLENESSNDNYDSDNDINTILNYSSSEDEYIKDKRSEKINNTTKYKRQTSLTNEIDNEYILKEDSVKEDSFFAKDSKKERKVKKKDSSVISGSDDTVDFTEEINQLFKTNLKKKESLKEPFSKEKLKSRLEAVFSSYGELKTEDGTVIDKDFIVNSLDMLTPSLLNRILETVSDPFRPSSSLKLFHFIQSKYKNEYLSVFDIQYLNTREKKLQEFQSRSQYESYISAKHKCEICFKPFSVLKTLTAHMKKHEESAGDFPCPICHIRYKSKSCLKQHKTKHGALYRCKLCPMITCNRTSMVYHYNQHKGNVYTCQECNKTYKSYSYYMAHKYNRHLRPNVCTLCGRAFFSLIGLKRHRAREHEGEVATIDKETGVTCDTCDLTFVTSEAYETHMPISHKNIGHTIRIPKYTPRQRRSAGPNAVRGPRVPKKEPVFPCLVCNATGNSIGWLNVHFHTEHPTEDMDQVYAHKRKHLCHICGKGFATVYILRDHLVVHSGSLPFPCAHCPARFARALSLLQHARRHRPPAYTCSRCGKQFHSTPNLNNHMKIHIRDRKYKCEICDKGFIHRNALNEHVKGVHYNVRRKRKECAPRTPGAPGAKRRRLAIITTEDNDQ